MCKIGRQTSGAFLTSNAPICQMHKQAVMLDGRETVIGRDPRSMTAAELNALGHRKRSLLRVIRENCIDCVGGSEAEVRRCAQVRCPMWPYRMSSNPFRAEMSEEDRRRAAQRLRPAGGGRPCP